MTAPTITMQYCFTCNKSWPAVASQTCPYCNPIQPAGTAALTQAEVDALLNPTEEPAYVGTASPGGGSIGAGGGALSVTIAATGGSNMAGGALVNNGPAGNTTVDLAILAKTLAAYALNLAFGATLGPFELEHIERLAKQVGCTVVPRQRTHAAIRAVLEELFQERLHQFELGFTPEYDDNNPLHGRMEALHRLADPNHTYAQIVEAAAILVADLERRKRLPVEPITGDNK